jgi:2-dehydropantoate 2-reductase
MRLRMWVRHRTSIRMRFSADRCERRYKGAMRILVIGVGGVGGVLAQRLAARGHDLRVVARGAHGEAIARHGITVRTPAGERNAPLHVLHAGEVADQSVDVAFVCVKWPELAGALAELARILAPDGVAVPLLNGLDAENISAQYVGAQRTVAGVAYMSAGIVAPGVIYEHGATKLGFACYRPGQERCVAALTALLLDAGVPAQTHEDAAAMLWSKMVWNAPFNAICALADLNAGAVVAEDGELVKLAMREVIAVARAHSVQLPDVLVDGMLHVTRSEYPDTEPSMLQDVRRGRPTEIDILAGRVAELGASRGVPTPVLATLASLVRMRTRATQS